MTRRGKGEGTVTQRKDGRWEAKLTLPTNGGKRQRRTFYGKTRTEVVRKLRDGQTKQDANLPLPNDRETVGLFLDTWLRDSAPSRLRPRTLASYQMIVERHLKPEIGKIVLSRLTPDAVERYMNVKSGAGLSARTVQYHHAVLRRALGQAERWGKVARNVAKLVSPPTVDRPEARPLTADEARSLLGGIAENRLAPLYALAIGLGLRQGELLGLQWSDIDLEVGTLTVRHTLQRYGREYHLDAPKTEKSRRTLALPKSLVHLLRAHRGEQLEEMMKAGQTWQGATWNLVFCTEAGKPLSGNNLTHQFQALLVSLGLPRQRFHDLRHATATYMLSQGVDLRVVMEVLGHSQIATTANTYAHVRIEATRAAAEQVDALLTG